MNIENDEIDEIYKDLLDIYEDGERALVHAYRTIKSDLEEEVRAQINGGGEDYTREEADYIFDILWKRIAALSDRTPAFLTPEQKKQVQRFYSTNAGASFINTWVRNSYIKNGAKIAEKHPDIISAIGAGAKEASSIHTVTLSTPGRTAIKTAFQQGDPGKVMRAALQPEEGENNTIHFATSQYRGTLVPKEELKQFKVGDIMVNTFFTSFSPDIYEPQKRGVDKKMHDGLKQALKFAQPSYKDHEGTPIIYEIPARQGYKTHLIHSIYEFETVVPPGEKFQIEAIDDKASPVRITLKSVDAKGIPVRIMRH